MVFSPAYLSSFIIEPLRYFFATYGGDDLKWTDDPKTSFIEVDTINNFNKIKIQAKPRLSISRGQYQIKPAGLTDSMASQKTMAEAKGLKIRTNFVIYDGVSQILVQARNEGTCEKVADLTTHFLLWTSAGLSGSQGFKSFANQMAVSPCVPDKEDTEIFNVTINLPWQREEDWTVKNDGIILKDILFNLNLAS